MNDLENNNIVKMSGEITTNAIFSHEMFGEGFYELNVKIKRLSDIYDIIPITISERLLQDVSLVIGNRIGIVGQYRSYNKFVDGKSKLCLTVFVREFVEDDGVDYNEVDFIGYVCKSPIYRTTPFSREICDVLLAVNRSYNKSDYIPCIAWGRNARYVKNFKVGDKVMSSGRIQSRMYQKVLANGDVVTKTAFEVSMNKVNLMNENNYVQSVVKTAKMGELVNYYS